VSAAISVPFDQLAGFGSESQTSAAMMASWIARPE
jgi:hypothetical protein